jgi:hypothetical protein
MIHFKKFTYDNFEYFGVKKNSLITCRVHGDFSMTPGDHRRGSGCPKCAGRYKTIQELIKELKEIHNSKYTYDFLESTNVNKRIIITCPTHGNFPQLLSDHQGGHGCPKYNSSRGEAFIRNVLKGLNIKAKEQYKNKKCKYKILLRFDFAIFDENKNIKFLIEYQGEQHYFPVNFGGWVEEESLKIFQENLIKDNIKKEFCKDNKIPLLEIKYDQLKDSESLIKDFQKNLK